MGRAGFEPATLGLKVLQFRRFTKMQKRRFAGSGSRFRPGHRVASSTGIPCEGRFFAVPFQMRIIGPVFGRSGLVCSRCVYRTGQESGGEASTSTAEARSRRDLIRRRAAGESLRSLGSDYGVPHTTLLDYFERPESLERSNGPRCSCGPSSERSPIAKRPTGGRKRRCAVRPESRPREGAGRREAPRRSSARSHPAHVAAGCD
jgi:hypothetical protein